jgi:nitrous oxide reductase
MSEGLMRKTSKQTRLHPAVTSAYVALGADAHGLTSSDYRLRNRLKNKLARTRDRALLERIAKLLEVDLD